MPSAAVNNPNANTAATKTTKARRKKDTVPMDMAKALVLAETDCYISVINKHYANPPLEISCLDCLTAKRPLPCSLCLARSDKTLLFPSPAESTLLPPLTPVANATTTTSIPKKLKLTRMERGIAEPALIAFGESIRVTEQNNGNYRHHPPSLFIPQTLAGAILDKFLLIRSSSDLDTIIGTWRHRSRHSVPLYTLIATLRTDILKKRDTVRLVRNARAREKRNAKRKATTDISGDEDHEEEVEEDEEDIEASVARKSSKSKSSQPRKRPALEPVTNLPQVIRARAPVLSVAATTQDYGPQYRPRRRHQVEKNAAEEPVGIRRSLRGG